MNHHEPNKSHIKTNPSSHIHPMPPNCAISIPLEADPIAPSMCEEKLTIHFHMQTTHKPKSMQETYDQKECGRAQNPKQLSKMDIENRLG